MLLMAGVSIESRTPSTDLKSGLSPFHCMTISYAHLVSQTNNATSIYPSMLPVPQYRNFLTAPSSPTSSVRPDLIVTTAPSKRDMPVGIDFVSWCLTNYILRRSTTTALKNANQYLRQTQPFVLFRAMGTLGRERDGERWERHVT